MIAVPRRRAAASRSSTATAQPSRPSPLAARRAQQAAAEVRACRQLGIGDRQHLEVAATERHDPVVRSEPLVASTAAGRERELALDPGGRRVEVGGRVDHVIDPHRFTEATARTSGPHACRGRLS